MAETPNTVEVDVVLGSLELRDGAPLLPGDMLAYDDGAEPMSMGERALGLVILVPWLGALWGWSVGVVAQEVARAVRGR